MISPKTNSIQLSLIFSNALGVFFNAPITPFELFLVNSLIVLLNILHEDEQRLSEDQELHLYRIVQEAISNIIKHAKASSITLDWHNSKRIFGLRIYDDGEGIPEAYKPKGMGLSNIESRIQLLGGKYRLQSKEENGTSLTLILFK